jgi:hypothetical protein
MDQMLDDEAATGRLNPADCVGHLVMVWAIDYIDHSPTKFSVPGKNSDVIVVDAVDLDQADHEGYQGQIFRNVWWRNGRLIAFMKTRIGRPKPVLARMAIGVNTMGKPPFELELMTHDEQAVERAAAWFAGHRDFRPGAPQGRSDDERITAEAPVAQQKSQLQQLAEQKLTGGNLHQQSLRELPPARPPARPDPYGEEAPF